MEHILKKIIEIDSKASNLNDMKSTLKIDIENELTEKKEILRYTIIGQGKKEGNHILEQFRDEAREEIEKINKESDEICLAIDNQYLKIKEALCEDIFNKIIELD